MFTLPNSQDQIQEDREHHGQYHANQPVAKSWRSCKAQRMKEEGAGSQCTFCEITVPRIAGPDLITKQLMEDLKEQLTNIQVPTDHWLIKLGYA
jgi:hypothetical protein